MNVQDIVVRLDQEISRLRQARDILTPLTVENPRGPFRPRGITSTHPAAVTPEKTPKRQLTAEGKRRIAEAQKARWAAKKAGAEHNATTEEAAATGSSTEIPVEV